MSLSASPSGAGQILSWAGSALAAAAVLTGMAALVATLTPPGESRGQIVAPVMLTLAAPEAVAALPTPLPEVTSDAPKVAQPPKVAPPAPDMTADDQVLVARSPRMGLGPSTDAPVVAQDLPPPPAPPKAEPQKSKPASSPKPAKPKPVPEPSATPAKAGDSGTSAKATRSDGATASTGNTKQAMQRWGSAIRKRIEAKKAYPAAAQGAQGTVTVRLTVSRTGQLLGVAVVASSGTAALDRAAVKAVQQARFPKAPDGVADDSASFTLPMKFAG